MKQMMRKYGMNIDEISDVEEIVIRTSTQEYVFSEAEVTVIDIQGQKTFQIVGEPEVMDRGSSDSAAGGEPRPKSRIPQADIELVAQQTGASKDEAREALEACDGNPAEAIMKLMEAEE
jgi:nascent polypeptide-associated complex subunit alpha